MDEKKKKEEKIIKIKIEINIKIKDKNNILNNDKQYISLLLLDLNKKKL